MAGRPRLVEEGKPIWNEDGSYPSPPASAQTPPEYSDTKKTKLSTRLVIGGSPKQWLRHRRPHRQPGGGSHGSGDVNDDDDLMMLDNSDRVIGTAGTASSLATAVFGNVAYERKGKRGRKTKICTRLVIGGEDDSNAPATGDANHHETMEVSVDDDAFPGGTVQGTFRAATGHGHPVPPHHDAASAVASEATPLSVDMEDDSAAFTSSEGECRMEVEVIAAKSPLVVMDGANVAYYYADAMAAEPSSHRRSDRGERGGPDRRGRRGRKEPDARGIKVAARYFLEGGCRVLVVVPAPWFRVKPRDGDHSSDNGLMLTPQVEILQDLKSKGLVCPSPPADDDDAYVLALARREDGRARKRAGGAGGGFVLSNDMFRDAIRRDERHDGRDEGPTSSAGSGLGEWLKRGGGAGPGRISYSFCDMDSMDEYGDDELDFVPNPRHPLIGWIERENRAKDLGAGAVR